MNRNNTVLFDLDAEGRHRLSFDDRKWILERRADGHAPPDGAAGYSEIGALATTRVLLMLRLRRIGIEPDDPARMLLERLPDTFSEFREAVTATGVDVFRASLLFKKEGAQAAPDLSEAA